MWLPRPLYGGLGIPGVCTCMRGRGEQSRHSPRMARLPRRTFRTLQRAPPCRPPAFLNVALPQLLSPLSRALSDLCPLAPLRTKCSLLTDS